MRTGQPSSCYLLERGEEAIVLDIGQGGFAGLASIRPPETLAAIFVSHLHPDHHVDLVPMRHYLKFGAPPGSMVRLHAPRELRSRYDAFLGEPDFLASMPGEDLSSGSTAVAGCLVEGRPVTHAHHSFGFRVSLASDPERPGLVYSGDCGRWQDLLPLMHPGDTLLCEAFWGVREPEERDMHLTAREAGTAAREGHVTRLVLTHVGDAKDPAGSVEQAQVEFGGPVALAQPGMQIRIV